MNLMTRVRLAWYVLWHGIPESPNRKMRRLMMKKMELPEIPKTVHHKTGWRTLPKPKEPPMFQDEK